MAKQHQLRLRPIGAVCHKQSLPIFGLQGLPNGRRGQQQGGVFIKQSEGIAQRAALGLHTITRNGLRLQLIQTAFGVGEAQPAQTIEKIVGVLSGGHLGVVKNKCFVSGASRQPGLRHK